MCKFYRLLNAISTCFAHPQMLRDKNWGFFDENFCTVFFIIHASDGTALEGFARDLYNRIDVAFDYARRYHRARVMCVSSSIEPKSSVQEESPKKKARRESSLQAQSIFSDTDREYMEFLSTHEEKPTIAFKTWPAW